MGGSHLCIFSLGRYTGDCRISVQVLRQREVGKPGFGANSGRGRLQIRQKWKQWLQEELRNKRYASIAKSQPRASVF